MTDTPSEPPQTPAETTVSTEPPQTPTETAVSAEPPQTPAETAVSAEPPQTPAESAGSTETPQTPANDSVLLSIDRIDFSYATWRRFQAYFVVIACDTNGKIYVSESPKTYPILHRPLRKKPGRIDFGFDGYPVYVSVGAVPSLVKYEVFVVRDRRGARQAGLIINEIGVSGVIPQTIGDVKSALTAAGAAGIAGVAGAAIGSAVEAAIEPITQIVGAIIATLGDKVVASCAGSKIFDARTMAQSELSVTTESEGGHVATELDILLFDRRDDAFDSGVGATLPSLHKEL